jgi:hypothetical protein
MSNTQSTNIPNRYTPGEIGDQIAVSGTTYECVGVHTFTHYKGVETTYEWVMLAGSGPDYVDDNKITTPETAEVGQTIVVEEVDENRKPIKWKCADALKQATETDFGGIKAKAKTEETLEVAVDAENGKLYAPNVYGNELEMLFDYTVTAEDVELYKITFTKDVYPQLAKIKNGLLVHAGTTSSANRVYTQVLINNVAVCGWEAGSWQTVATGCFFRNGYALKQSSQSGNRYVALALDASGVFFFDNGDVGISSTKKLSNIPDFPNINSITLGSWDKGFLPEDTHLRFYAF